MNDLDPNEYISQPFVAGIIGALVGLWIVPGKSWFERFGNLFAACAIAWFGAPAAIEFFAVQSSGMQGFMGFAIGLFGLSITSAIFAGIRETKLNEIWTGWIKRP